VERVILAVALHLRLSRIFTCLKKCVASSKNALNIFKNILLPSHISHPSCNDIQNTHKPKKCLHVGPKKLASDAV